MSKAPSQHQPEQTRPEASIEDLPTRGYQQEMLEASLRRNVVIAMDTGSGKTHIAVLRMKIEAERERTKISWFLAPTVGLCEQQRAVIRTSLPLPVGLISGALEPDQWTNPSIWRTVLSSYRIIVSTPQVFLDALRHAYIKLGSDISLLIFDEAHHAADKHPYNMIMREFYDKCKPRTGNVDAGKATREGVQEIRPFVLGLTASPAFGGNIGNAFAKLEKNLDSIILSPSRTRSELLQYVQRPIFKHVLHEPADYDGASSRNVEALHAVIEGLEIENDPSVIAMREKLSQVLASEGRNSSNYVRLDQRLSRALHRKETFVLEGLRAFLRTAKELCADIGTWAADWYVSSVVSKVLGSLSADHSSHTIFAERNYKEKQYLAEILRRIDIHAPDYAPEAIAAGCTDKTCKLIACLKSEKAEWDALGEVYSGLVFATRRDAVLALAEFLSQHPETKDTFVIGTLLGGSESSRRNAFLDITRTFIKQTQIEILSDFRLGLKNLVISTAVAEEGIDIQACGNVVRWDVPQNMVSWAQSRGRARHKKSSVILMFETNMTHASSIQKWERLEVEMVQRYTDEQRHLRAIVALQEGREDEDKEYDEFRLPSTGAVVTLDSAVPHLSHFCNVLPSTVHTPEQPIYDIFPEDYPEGYHIAPQATVVLPNTGPYGCLLNLPKLLPAHLRVYRTEQVYKTKKAARRRAAFMAYVSMYRAGLLNDNLLPLTSSFEKLQEAEVNFILRDIEKREGLAYVHEQVNPWLPLVSSLPNRKWWSNELRISGLGSFRMLTQMQMPHLEYSEMLYDPNFGPRSFSIIPVTSNALSPDDILSAKYYTRRVFSIFYGSRIDWEDLNFSYLFLPMNGQDDSQWIERRDWADSLRSAEGKYNARERVLAKATDFASKFSCADDAHMVLERGSRGSNFYRLLGWQNDRLAEAEEKNVLQRYRNAKGEGPEVRYPLILAVLQHSRMNFLLPQHYGSAQRELVYLLPQFTSVVLASETDIQFSLFLPSILRAVLIKLVAFRLQEALSQKVPEFRNVSLDLIKTALVTPAANTHYNYERLESLGDTILKFVTSIQLLAEYPHWPEGFLSKARDHAVSNVNLAKNALGKQLYKYIIRKMFLAKKWKPDYTKQTTLIETDLESDEGISSMNDAGNDIEGSEDAIVKLSTKTLADVVESLIGAAYLSGGFECSIACMKTFDIGVDYQPVPQRVMSVLSRVQLCVDLPVQLGYPEVMLGYVFRQKMLLAEALMHTSCQSDIHTVSYERMEFLGDAVLDVIVCEILFHADGKNYTPGQIQARKAALVNSHFLAYICLKTRFMLSSHMPRWDAAKGMSISTDEQEVYLWQCLLHSSPRILDEQFETYTRYRHAREEIDQALKTGCMYPWAALMSLQAPKFFSDVIESLIGAIYIDSEGNWGAVRQVLERLGVLTILRRIVRDEVDIRHPISRVQQWMTKFREKKTEYDTAVGDGMVTVRLLVDGEVIHAVTERYVGRYSKEEVKFRVAEEGIKILEKKFGTESEVY